MQACLKAMAILGIVAAVAGAYFFAEQYAPKSALDEARQGLATLRMEVGSLGRILQEQRADYQTRLNEASNTILGLRTMVEELNNTLSEWRRISQSELEPINKALAALQTTFQELNHTYVSKTELVSTFINYQQVDITLGPLPSGKPKELSYPLPESVPATAREILVYAYVAMNYVKGGTQNFKIFVKVDATREAAFYLYAIANPQQEWSFNSDNMWLPMPKDRTLRLQANGEEVFGKWESGVRIVAYR